MKAVRQIPNKMVRMGSSHVRCEAKRPSFGERGLTLVELIVAFTILMILSSMALPLARHQVQRQREKLLLDDLREMRAAINRFKDMCDLGKVQSPNVDSYCYPATLESLVDGVKLNNTVAGLGSTGKMRFLRRIPKDPMTGETDWGKRSMQDDPTTNTWGGQNVFDVFTKSTDKASDGTAYSEW
jgi:general secretion pathway protein G